MVHLSTRSGNLSSFPEVKVCLKSMGLKPAASSNRQFHVERKPDEDFKVIFGDGTQECMGLSSTGCTVCLWCLFVQWLVVLVDVSSVLYVSICFLKRWRPASDAGCILRTRSKTEPLRKAGKHYFRDCQGKRFPSRHSILLTSFNLCSPNWTWRCNDWSLRRDLVLSIVWFVWFCLCILHVYVRMTCQAYQVQRQPGV